MKSARRSLIALFAATFAQLTGFFLFGPWLLFTLKDQGLGTAAVGAFGALQWAGLLVATPFASSWAQRLGPRLALLLVPYWSPLAWVIAFVWGGAGAALYTLAMVEIGHRHQGLALVNSTAVLVMAYTAGGMLAPAAGGLMLQWAPTLGFPALLLAVAALGLWGGAGSTRR